MEQDTPPVAADIDILIAEDSPTQARLLRNLLGKQGFTVTAALNGLEALEHLEHHQPTLIISDIVMPEMDGYELCRRIKSDERLRDIPVILLTNLSEPTDIIKGLEVKADNFITKPYEEKFLISRIQHVLVNMEIRKKQTSGMGIELFFAGKKHFLTSDRIQVLDLLISSFEVAVQKYRELEIVNRELDRANAELQESYRLLSQQAKELQALSLVDELTGLHNRRSFQGLAEQQIKIAARTKKEMLFFFADLDNMKWINDNLGHKEGDLALMETAEILRKTFRDSDIIARLGGDEFGILLIDIEPGGCEQFLNRLKENTDIHNAQSNPLREISISIGMAVFDPEYPVSFHELVEQADRMMYEHKKRRQKQRFGWS